MLADNLTFCLPPGNKKVPCWCGHTNKGHHGLRHENSINIAQAVKNCKPYFRWRGGVSR